MSKTVKINAEGGTGDYQYSIDGSNYQSSNTFVEVEEGDYYGYVKDENNCEASGSFNINIITTNLDLPDEPEPDEFVAASNDYSWRTFRTTEAIRGYGAGRSHFRYINVRWLPDDNETNFMSLATSPRARHYVWIPEFAISHDAFDAVGSSSAVATHTSSLYSNRRHLNQNGMDLLFSFGIYKPMNHDVQKIIYASAQNDYAGNLTMRDGNISNYVNKIIPVIKHDGTDGTNPADPQYITVSRIADPLDSEYHILEDFYNAEYSMTFDGFDADLWEFTTTMAPGFSYKNQSAKNSGIGFQDYEMWSSRLFAKEGRYDEQLDPVSNLKLDDNPMLILDGYMYYRGNQSTYSSDAGLIGDKVFDGDPPANKGVYSLTRFAYDVARKPLGSDHTMQTVADALKERRSNRTVTKIPARPSINGTRSFIIDGEVKKFQSGDWYYPTNSLKNGTDFSNVTASTPYVVDTTDPTNLFLREHYYAKNFTIGST